MQTQKLLSCLLQKRRQLCFQRQRAQREEFVKASRLAFFKIQQQQLSTPQPQPSPETPTTATLEVQQFPPSPLSNLKHQRLKPPPKKPHSHHPSYSRLSKRLQIPSHLTSLPCDLPTSFLLYARPAGKPILLLLKNNRITIISKSGHILKVITSNYLISPYKTILEGILSETHPTRIFITDVLQWKGELKVGEGALFRHYWLNSNLPKVFGENQENDFSFELVRVERAGREEFARVYGEEEGVGKRKDGVVFIHEQAVYGGYNPGVLVWKDEKVAAYWNVEDAIKGVGDIRDGGVWSGDGQMVRKLEEWQVEEWKAFKQVKFSYTKISIQEKGMKVEEEGEEPKEEEEIGVEIEGFQCEELLVRWRSPADSLSKLVFQYQARVAPITAEEIYGCLK